MKARNLKLLIGLSLVFSIFNANATLISELDLDTLTFETNFDIGETTTLLRVSDDQAGPTVATGTSNGIGYTFEAQTPFFVDFSNMVSAQAFNDLPNSYDDIHAGASFTITFDQPITSLLVALANDNDSDDGPDFGQLPSDFTGVSFLGTKAQITDIGGALMLFEFGSPISSFTHTNDAITDGWDLAFFAFRDFEDPIDPPTGIPAPGVFYLMALGLTLLSLKRNR